MWRRHGAGADGPDGEMVLELRLRWDDPRAGEESAMYSLVGKKGRTDGDAACDLSVVTYVRIDGSDGGRCTYSMVGDRVV